MVSGRATKPSDIHTSAAGKTVEVNDTDAEGRLTLADALWYAQTQAGATVSENTSAANTQKGCSHQQIRSACNRTAHQQACLC